MSTDAPSRHPPRYRMVHFTRWKAGLVLAIAMFAIVTALPTFLPSSALHHWPSWLPNDRLHLGIEYTGGTRVVFAADRDAFRHDYLVRLRKSVHDVLLEKRYTHARVVVAGDHLIARFATPSERKQAYELLDANFNTFAHTWVALERRNATAIVLTVPAGVLDDALNRAMDGVAAGAKHAFPY